MFGNPIISLRFCATKPSATEQAQSNPITHQAIIFPAFISFLSSGRYVGAGKSEDNGNQPEIRPFARHSG
jgi:hypothetical protein